MADWDDNSPRLSKNLRDVLHLVRDKARARRPLTKQDVREWHQRIMRGLDVPDTAYIGAFRGEPGVMGVRVFIGTAEGTPPSKVAAELDAFDAHLGDALAFLDELIAPMATPDGEALAAVLDLMAWAHAEWVRIHPFANGNGRTARLWANAIAMRYGLPPFVILRPRPENDGYAAAAAQAMNGDWEPTARCFRALLDRFLGA